MGMIELASMAVQMPEVHGHPNRRAFRGVLTVVDAPSQRSPSGAKGHLVVLTRVAAEVALPSLLGMALDYAPTLDRHDVRRKVGVITRADLVGRKLEIGGHLFARDFPEIVEEIAKCREANADDGFRPPDASRYCAGSGLPMLAGQVPPRVSGRCMGASTPWPGQGRNCASVRRGMTLHAWNPHRASGAMISSAGGTSLGMSYEVTDVQLADTRAQVWTLMKVTFTGAAILRRDKAAYQDTWIELG
jgi:hypothetical protein